jgi:hypothetical protein
MALHNVQVGGYSVPVKELFGKMPAPGGGFRPPAILGQGGTPQTPALPFMPVTMSKEAPTQSNSANGTITFDFQYTSHFSERAITYDQGEFIWEVIPTPKDLSAYNTELEKANKKGIRPIRVAGERELITCLAEKKNESFFETHSLNFLGVFLTNRNPPSGMPIPAQLNVQFGTFAVRGRALISPYFAGQRIYPGTHLYLFVLEDTNQKIHFFHYTSLNGRMQQVEDRFLETLSPHRKLYDLPDEIDKATAPEAAYRPFRVLGSRMRYAVHLGRMVHPYTGRPDDKGITHDIATGNLSGLTMNNRKPYDPYMQSCMISAPACQYTITGFLMDPKARPVHNAYTSGGGGAKALAKEIGDAWRSTAAVWFTRCLNEGVGHTYADTNYADLERYMRKREDLAKHQVHPQNVMNRPGELRFGAHAPSAHAASKHSLDDDASTGEGAAAEASGMDDVNPITRGFPPMMRDAPEDPDDFFGAGRAPPQLADAPTWSESNIVVGGGADVPIQHGASLFTEAQLGGLEGMLRDPTQPHQPPQAQQRRKKHKTIRVGGDPPSDGET